MNSLMLSCLVLALATNVLCFSYYDPSSYGQIDTVNLGTGSAGNSYQYAAARFGPQLPAGEDRFRGVVHAPASVYGCKNVEPPPTAQLPSPYGWVALLKRSKKYSHVVKESCTFIEKVLSAQASGYSAVIIYNNNPADPDPMIMDASNNTLIRKVQIPSVFINMEDGIELSLHSYPDEQTNMTAVFFTPLADDINPYKILIPMAFSFVGILLITCIVMVVRWCQAIRRRRSSRMSKSQLKKIPIHKYSKDDQYDCCAICLDDYEEGERLRLLPCAHTFHQKCVDPWLLKNKKTCPVCKRRVIPKPRRRRRPRQRVPSESSESSGSDTAEPTNERTPLLPPPAGNQSVLDTGNSSLYGSGLPSSAPPVSAGASALAGTAAASASSNLMDQELPHPDSNEDTDTDTNHLGYFMTDETKSNPEGASAHSLKSIAIINSDDENSGMPQPAQPPILENPEPSTSSSVLCVEIDDSSHDQSASLTPDQLENGRNSVV